MNQTVAPSDSIEAEHRCVHWRPSQRSALPSENVGATVGPGGGVGHSAAVGETVMANTGKRVVTGAFGVERRLDRSAAYG